MYIVETIGKYYGVCNIYYKLCFLNFTGKKSERRHNGSKPVITKCYYVLLLSDKVEVKNYIAMSIFLRVHHLFFKAGK